MIGMGNRYMFSPSENSFLPKEMKADYVAAGTWPEDAVDIPDHYFKCYSKNPPEGKCRGVVDGLPCWVDEEKSDHEVEVSNNQIRATLFAKVQRKADALATAVDLGMATKEEEAQLDKLKRFKVELMRIDVKSRSLVWPDIPDVELM